MRRSYASRRTVWVAALLVVAAWLRLQGLDWDQGQHLHPDERFLTMVGTDIHRPGSIQEYFDTVRSPMNPANAGGRFFAYGTFPLFLVKGVADAIGLSDYDHIHLVGRAFSALFDLGTVALTYRIGLVLAGPGAAIGAGALMAFSVTSIQQAHFFTVDSFATFFATASILMLVRVARGEGLRWHALFGIAFGLTLACRINVSVLSSLYPVSLVYAWRARHTNLRVLIPGSALAVLATILVFRIFQPYAFAGPGFFDISLAPDFVASMATVRAYAIGAVDFPPAVQWIGRLPIVFPGRQLFLWGLGPTWAMAALAGMIWCFVRRRPAGVGEEIGAGRVVLLWVPLLFFFHAIQFSAIGRYFLPIVPLLAVAAAWVLGGPGSSRTGRMLLVGTVALTAVWAIAFTSIYRRPHTRVDASRWIYENIEPQAAIAVEHWDDSLPLPVDRRTPAIYKRIELKLYDDENEEKRRQLLAGLDAADVIVLSSNRLYGSIPRAPWRYPLGRRYYELLFAGELGFRLERVFTSYPRLGSIEFADDGAEEAFTVYDHPKVLVFRKTEEYSPDRVAPLLNAVSLAGILRVPPRDAAVLYHRIAPTDVRLAGEGAVRSPAATSGIGSLGALTRWLVCFEVLSLAFFALLFRPLKATRDRGYGLAKLVAWLGCGTVMWLFASTGLASHTVESVRMIAGVFVLAGALTAWHYRDEIAVFCRSNRLAVLSIEAVFLVTFGLFLSIRAFNPAIFWGEKPMDFAIVNASLRAVTMPPPDPWFAGEPLNYFYFGHALTASFATLAGVPPAFAFNLAVATVAGMLATAVFLFVHQLSARIAASVLAAFAVVIVGNLAGPRIFLADSPVTLNFDYFWATSRVIAGTINEFPFWNLVFADLHAHVLAMPFEVALLYLGSLWSARGAAGERVAGPFLGVMIAWFLGSVAVTSSWSVPTAVALQLGLLATASIDSGKTMRALARGIAWWIAIMVMACVIFWPFWSHYVPPVRHWAWLKDASTPVADVLTIFGVFVVATLPALNRGIVDWVRDRPWGVRVVVAVLVLASAASYLRSPACGLFVVWASAGALAWLTAPTVIVRTGAMLIAAAGGIGIATECVVVWDRMNTVFKYYLQMWLLVGCGGALLAWSALHQVTVRRRRLLALVFAGVTTAGVFTSVTGLIGFLRTPHAPSPIFTLDGMAYLESASASELDAYRWFNREVAGIPVVLEAQGAPYQAFSRVSMNTGLPTVLGWEYHLVQQGRDREQIDARARDVREVYETTNLAQAEQLLRKYHIDFVFVGPLERRTYASAGLAKFDASPLVEPVFKKGDVTIYATPGRVRSVKTWIERVPPSSPTLSARAALREPRGIVAAPDRTLFVADFGNRRVQRLGTDRQPIAAFGSEGEGPGEFRDPCGIAIGSDGSVWVADTWNHRIQKLTPDGRQVVEWRAGFYGPRGIAVSHQGLVYVTDTGNHRVIRFTPDGTPHVLVDRSSLDHPIGIALGEGGEIYVADVGHGRVAVFSSEGRLEREWPIEGWASRPLIEPYLAVGPDGVIWVTDPAGKRVLLYDRNGNRLGAAVPESPLDLPLGIALLDRDTAVVTDAARSEVILVRRDRAGKS